MHSPLSVAKYLSCHLFRNSSCFLRNTSGVMRPSFIFLLKTCSLIFRSSGSSPATSVKQFVVAVLYALVIASKGFLCMEPSLFLHFSWLTPSHQTSDPYRILGKKTPSYIILAVLLLIPQLAENIPLSLLYRYSDLCASDKIWSECACIGSNITPSYLPVLVALIIATLLAVPKLTL